MTPTEGGTGAEPVDGVNPDGAVTVAAGPESTEAAAAEAALAGAPEVMAGSLAEYARLWLRRVRSGRAGCCRS
jgi:hypothetical protein